MDATGFILKATTDASAGIPTCPNCPRHILMLISKARLVSRTFLKLPRLTQPTSY